MMGSRLVSVCYEGKREWEGKARGHERSGLTLHCVSYPIPRNPCHVPRAAYPTPVTPRYVPHVTYPVPSTPCRVR